MGNNKKQTAVEWLIDKVEEHFCLLPVDLFEQAKAMEKEQITESHLRGLYSEIKMKGEKQAEQYYNETYDKQDNEK